MTQTKTQHTPGPWTVEPSMDLGGTYFINEVGDDVEWDEDEANARLIAAAPRLLAALRLAYGELLFMQDRDEEVLAVIEAAIAKAEGRGQ